MSDYGHSVFGYGRSDKQFLVNRKSQKILTK